MRNLRPTPLTGTVLLVLLLAAGCKDNGVTPPGPDADAVPDFSLEDVNATSPTAGDMVSPRDHLRQVSAWYFGHAT